MMQDFGQRSEAVGLSQVSKMLWQLTGQISAHYSFMPIDVIDIHDVIKFRFLKLWDFLGYFERTTSERPTCEKLALWGKLSRRYYSPVLL